MYELKKIGKIFRGKFVLQKENNLPDRGLATAEKHWLTAHYNCINFGIL